MKRLPLFILIPILILFCSIVHVQAASGLICGISISGDNISKNYNFSPGVSEYTIYVLSPGTINIDIQAANDDTLLTANGQQSLGQLSLSKELAKEKTVISITARNGQTQTVSITFILRESESNSSTSDNQTNIDSPGLNYPDNQENPSLPSGTTDDESGLPDPGAADEQSGEEQNNGADHTTGNGQPTTLTFQIGNYTMEVNGEPRQLDAAPMLISPGHTLVPVRFITEALGGTVIWLQEQQKVELWLDGQYFALTIGENVPGTNVAATIYNSRTFVPLRFVMESFGAQVEWFGQEKVIFIIYPAQ